MARNEHGPRRPSWIKAQPELGLSPARAQRGVLSFRILWQISESLRRKSFLNPWHWLGFAVAWGSCLSARGNLFAQPTGTNILRPQREAREKLCALSVSVLGQPCWAKRTSSRICITLFTTHLGIFIAISVSHRSIRAPLRPRRSTKFANGGYHGGKHRCRSDQKSELAGPHR